MRFALQREGSDGPSLCAFLLWRCSAQSGSVEFDTPFCEQMLDVIAVFACGANGGTLP